MMLVIYILFVAGFVYGYIIGWDTYGFVVSMFCFGCMFAAFLKFLHNKIKVPEIRKNPKFLRPSIQISKQNYLSKENG